MKTLFTTATLLIAVITITVSSETYAHTELDIATPGDGAVLDASPDALELGFTARVDLVEVKLLDSDKAVIDTGFTAPEATISEIAVPLPHLQDGQYTVEWTAVGEEDGHTVLGDFSFVVDADDAY